MEDSRRCKKRWSQKVEAEVSNRLQSITHLSTVTPYRSRQARYEERVKVAIVIWKMCLQPFRAATAAVKLLWKRTHAGCFAS